MELNRVESYSSTSIEQLQPSLNLAISSFERRIFSSPGPSDERLKRRALGSDELTQTFVT